MRILAHPNSRRRLRRAAGAAAVAALVGVAVFLDLGRPGLWEPGEGRYAQTVYEMLVTGNWLEPTLGFTQYFDKPPGFYWLLAASFELFGRSEWAARLPSALAAVLTIAATVGFAWRRMGASTAIGAGAILATVGFFVALGRVVRMDMVLTLLLSVTLFEAYRLWEGSDGDATASRRGSWPLWVCPALGFLVKGPIAFLLPALVIAGFAGVNRDRARLRRLRPGAGALLAAGLAGSWVVAAAIWTPEYLWTFFWHHNVGRFLRADTGHGEPIWYFLWMLPVAFLPWTLFLPGALGRALRRARRGRHLERFLLLWAAVPVAFFSLSEAKLATYVLPVLPPLALLVSRYLVAAWRAPILVRRRAFVGPGFLWTGAVLVVGLGLPIAVALFQPAFRVQATAALLLLPFASLTYRAVLQTNWRAVPLLVLAGALTTQALFYRVAAPVVDDFISLRAAAAAAAVLPADAPVFAFKTRGHSFSFYSGRTLTRVRSPQAAAAVLADDAPVGLLTKARYLEAICETLGLPLAIWWRGASGRVLIANVTRTAAIAAGGESERLGRAEAERAATSRAASRAQPSLGPPSPCFDAVRHTR